MRRALNNAAQDTPRQRCCRCCRALAACLCDQLHPVQNDCPVLILQDAAEARHALGTAVIAALGLARCEVVQVRPGDQEAADEAIERLLMQQPVLVYPGADACPVSELDNTRPLLFIDATWRKSRRLLLGHPRLAALPRAALVNPPRSRYRLRKSQRPDDVSTLEAIAFALAAVEHALEKYLPLLRTMDWMVQQQLDCMGEAVYRKNYSSK